MSIKNLFVRLTNAKTSTFHDIDISMKVSEFIKKVEDKEGFKEVRLIYGAKQLRPELTLKDYNIKDESTIFALFTLLGGAQMPDVVVPGPGDPKYDPETNNILQINKKKIINFGGSVVVKENCLINASDGCTNPKICKAKINKCGHVVCAECMRFKINTIVTNGKAKLSCVESSCSTVLDINLAFNICNYNKLEWKENQEKLDTNFMKEKYGECPNQKCGAYVERKTADDVRVKCPVCKQYEYCWKCKKKWNSSNFKLCGNNECNSMAADIIVALNDGFKKDNLKIISGVKNVPNIRACPYCFALNEHKSGCKEMTCQCGKKYCHICCKKWDVPNGCNQENDCKVADVQIIPMSMLRNAK